MTSCYTRLAAGAAVLLTGAVADAQDITGAGATFPAPVYTKWAGAAKSAVGVTLNYQGARLRGRPEPDHQRHR